MPGDDDDDTKTQLWNTTVQSLYGESSTADGIGHCICCCKPLLKQDHGTRKMCMREVFHALTQVPADTSPCGVREWQTREIASGRETYVCYICEPMCKKAQNQFDLTQPVTHPSIFLTKTISHLQSVGCLIDKLSLIKALLCCMAQISSPAGVVYHPLRSKYFEVLEGVILFMKLVFEEHCCTVREFSRQKSLCPFIITYTVRWHLQGCPFYFGDMKASAKVRKLSKGPLLAIYGKTFHDDEYFSATDMYRGIMHGSDPACAMCLADRVPLSDDTYEANFLMPPEDINRHMCTVNSASGVADREGFVFCTKSHCFAARSFAYYQRFSSHFPAIFQHRHKQRYYSDLFRQPLESE